MWDRWAVRYAKQEHLEARALGVALRLAVPTRQDRLVDLGCGTGALLRALAARPDAPEIATGVDRSTGMLHRVGGLPSGWSTVVADARSVPLPDGCATVVTCTYVLHLLGPDARAAVLLEARRLLGTRPGARLVIVSVWPSQATAGGRLLRRGLRAIAMGWPAGLGGLLPYDPQRDVAAAGFEVARRVELPRGGYPSVVVLAHPRR